MNKKLLALAIGSAVAMPVIALADGPTLYGKLNVTLDSIEMDTGVAATSTDAWYLNSNASRLGVKGDAETGVEGLKGIYLAEFEMFVDDGDSGKNLGGKEAFTQRNIYAGLKGDFGTIKAGNFDTPLKEAQGKVDQFNDLEGDIKNIMAGENRVKNIIQYSSPKLADAFTVNVAVMPGEYADVDGDGKPDDGLSDSMSASVVMEMDAFYAALAVDSTLAQTGVEVAAPGDVMRLVGGYKADGFELGAIYQTAEDATTGGTAEDTSMLVSGAVISGDWKFKAQFGTGEGDVSSKEKTLMGVGADYKLGKNSTAFAYYASVETDNKAPALDAEKTTLGFGLEHKF